MYEETWQENWTTKQAAMKAFLATLGLLAVTAVWGWTFTVVKEAVARFEVVGFLFWRFLLASLVMGFWARQGLSVGLVRDGLLAGSWLAAAYLFQTWGLHYTSATNCGLITGLFVVLTPLLQWAVASRAVSAAQWVAAGLSFGGMVLLTGSGPDPWRVGDGLTVGAALCFAAHIVYLGRVAHRHAASALAAWQFIAVTLILAAPLAAEGSIPLPPASVLPALAITGLLATAAGFFVQTAAQKILAPTQAAVIMACESAFAAGFGVWLAGDRLTLPQWLGAALVTGAAVGVELFHHRSGSAPPAENPA
ncbi:MAG: permease [Pirellulaceae bacterium]|nr:MAG: permease [Pirellulaceae bacterium]